jgi:L-methionine (R)-S-oxide reductase
MPMFDSTPIANPADKTAFYLELDQQLASLIEGEPDAIANAANMSALLYHAMPELNWAGFYFLPEGTDVLVVGPFQGKPACVRIPISKGVCGTAVATRETILVPDVHAFPGHIACDAASQSELVVPLIRDGRVLGVLDLDSPRAGRFDADDQIGIERLVARYVANLPA